MIQVELDSMTPEQFAYWLQGMLETKVGNKLTEAQVQQIRDHLNQVFLKRTPTVTTTSYPPLDPAFKDKGTFIC